jgi:hypothetical protein
MLSGQPALSRSSSVTIDASTNPKHNHLLAALPPDQWQRWLPHLEHLEIAVVGNGAHPSIELIRSFASMPPRESSLTLSNSGRT